MSLFARFRQSSEPETKSVAVNSIRLCFTAGSEVDVPPSVITEGMTVYDLVSDYADELGLDPDEVNRVRRNNEVVGLHDPIQTGSTYSFFVTSGGKGAA